jgi:hypothetical protein
MSLPRTLLGLVIALAPFGQANAQSPAASKAAFLFDQAEKYVIRREGDAQPLVLKPEPIFNWTNPERLGHKGTVYLWLSGDRPEVIGSLFTYELRGQVFEKHAFHSLSDKPLEAKLGEQIAWKPRESGLKWQPLSGPAPAPTSRQRQTQMRQLARNFECTLIDPKNGPTALRFLPKPLYEYSAPEEGAIFAFVIATDPEALLLIESAEPGWRYAFARFHYWELRAKHHGQEVWKVPADDQMHNRLGNAGHLESIYNSFGVGSPKTIEK